MKLFWVSSKKSEMKAIVAADKTSEAKRIASQAFDEPTGDLISERAIRIVNRTEEE